MEKMTRFVMDPKYSHEREINLACPEVEVQC
jgi:hypothetical protein